MHPKRIENPSAKRPKASNRDMDTLVRAAWEQGWWCVQGGRNCVKDYPGCMTGAGSSQASAALEQQELAVRIGLMALPGVSDSLLEEMTICVEDALSENAGEIAPGASASANFADRAIELDFSVVTTPVDVHRLAGEVLRIAMEVLDQHADRAVVSFGSSAASPVLVAA